MKDPKIAAAVAGLVLALAGLVGAGQQYLEAKAERERAEAKAVEARMAKAETLKAWGEFGDYIVATLKEGCNP